MSFKPKAYVKEGCPHSCKFLVFMSETGLLDQIEMVRVNPDDVYFAELKEGLSQELGKPATFPTVEIAAGQYLTDSDRLIEYFADMHHVARGAFLAFYQQTIMPKLQELHRLKNPK